LACTLVLGGGTAFIWPAVYAITADVYPGERRGKVIGFLNVGQLAGFGLGALAGALLIERYPDVVFGIAIAAVAAAALPVAFGVPRYAVPSDVTVAPERG